MVEAKAQLNSLRMSPQKVRLVADLIRGLHVREAEAQLQFSRKAAAKPLYILLKSAIANAAHNHKIDTSTLVISTIFVNEGVVLKRWMPRAMGRATPLRKRSSHVTLVLSGESSATPDTKEKKVESETETPGSAPQKKKTTVKKVTKPRARKRASAS